jgi:hypothetical protein
VQLVPAKVPALAGIAGPPGPNGLW